MTPIALYPSRENLRKTAAFGAFTLALAFVFCWWAPDAGGVVPAVLSLVGGVLMAQAAKNYVTPKPCFEADCDGFSVMGRKKRGWDEFRGATIYTVRVGVFAIVRRVVVKTGKPVFGRAIHIRTTHLSASAAEMVAQIEQYAKRAQITLVFESGPVDYVSPPAGSDTATGAQTRAENPAAVSAAARIKARIFRRQKVI